MSEKFPDVMVDLETTGLNKGLNTVIQIAAVRFNLAERTIDVDTMFDRCLTVPTTRAWDEKTREWWLKDKREILMGLITRMEPHQIVLNDFYQWATAEGPLKFWGKPSHFDYSFLESLYQEFGPAQPFHYRTTENMNSFIRGRYWPNQPPAWERELPFEGPPHNAIFDVLHQIKALFTAMDHIEGKGQFANVVDGQVTEVTEAPWN